MYWKTNKIEISKEKHQTENTQNDNKTSRYVFIGDWDCNNKR
jgi:hypothetical protein